MNYDPIAGLNGVVARFGPHQRVTPLCSFEVRWIMAKNMLARRMLLEKKIRDNPRDRQTVK